LMWGLERGTSGDPGPATRMKEGVKNEKSKKGKNGEGERESGFGEKAVSGRAN